MTLKNYYNNLQRSMYGLILFSIISCNMDQHITPPEVVLSESDEIFISEATYVNLISIEYSQLAENKTINGLILAYADRMINEHSVAAGFLDIIAEDFEVETPDTVHADAQANLNQLSEINGDAFDSLYIQKCIEIHLWAQEVMEAQLSMSDVDVLINYGNQQLTQINQRLSDALLIQSELQ